MKVVNREADTIDPNLIAVTVRRRSFPFYTETTYVGRGGKWRDRDTGLEVRSVERNYPLLRALAGAEWVFDREASADDPRRGELALAGDVS